MKCKECPMYLKQEDKPKMNAAKVWPGLCETCLRAKIDALGLGEPAAAKPSVN